APALDAARGLETRDGGHEVPAGQVVGRRERFAGAIVRILLRDRRPAERAPADDSEERAGGPAQLPADDGSIVVHRAMVAARFARLMRRVRPLRLPPARDPLDDEQALTGPDEPEPARRTDHRLAALAERQPGFERPLLGRERLHLGGARRER